MKKLSKEVSREVSKERKVNSFIKIDNNKAILNMDNVTNVTFTNIKNRIIFNLSNNIEIHTQNGKQIISDYRYDDSWDVDEFALQKSKVIKVMTKNKWISPLYEGHHWINPSYITFVNVDYSRFRVMINLSNSITKPIGTNKEMMLVNDFVFWTHDCEEDMEASLEHINNILETL
jgi:hypothetical protein